MDDKWGYAIDQYLDQPCDKDPDPVPLARLLLTDEPIPQDVRDFLAEQINPTLPFHGNWHVQVVWTGALDNFHRKGLRNLNIALEMEETKRSGSPIGKTADSVGERFKISGRQVYKIWAAWRDAWEKFGLTLVRKPKRPNQN